MSLIQQYEEMKQKHPDAILLFRVGDFYEAFKKDAQAISEICGLTLTQRPNGNNGEKIYLAGFPHHALNDYLPKLVKAGKRVAVCEQLEDPKLAKKIVKREDSQKTKQNKPRKYINYNQDMIDKLQTIEPIAWFSIKVPKSAAKLGEYIKKDIQPQLAKIIIEPENGVMVSSNAHILQSVSVVCEGKWLTAEANGDKALQCSIDPKAIKRLAGRTIDVAVYRNENKTITIIEEPHTATMFVSEHSFPLNWANIIRSEYEKERIEIAKDELPKLQQWLKENAGKLSENRGIQLNATPESDTIRMRIFSDLTDEEEICEPMDFKLSEKTGYIQLRYAAYLFYLSVEGDFNGELLVQDKKPASFKGEMRETILMPVAYEYSYCSDMNTKPECLKI